MTPRPALVVVCGLPGVGKTTVARTITERKGARLIRTDVVRKELFPEPEYTKAEEQAVYTELLSRAAGTLRAGQSVVLDGTFYDATYRGQAEEVAAECEVRMRMVHVTCEECVVEERIRAREGDESDATFEIHQRFREKFDPIERDHVTVDNSGQKSKSLDRIRTAFHPQVEAE